MDLSHPPAMYWSYEKELLMIKYFEQHRYLWDTDHVLFHKRFPRMQGFAELVELLGIDEATIRQRWSSMRSQFCREERKVAACNSYVPTWDHYTSLLFLKKPNEEAGANKTQIKLEPTIFRVEEDIEFNSLTSGSNPNEDGYEETFTENNILPANTQFSTKSDLDASSHQQEMGHDQGENSFSLNSRLLHSKNSLSRAQARKYRRLNRLYSSRLKTDSLPQSEASVMNSTVVTNNKQPTENECFSQYINSVLTRFSANKQRKCRNEILRIILKYDIGDDEPHLDVS